MVKELDIIGNQGLLLTVNEQAFIEQKKREQKIKDSVMEIVKKTDYNRFFEIGMLEVYLHTLKL